jgi:carbon storage regulator
MLVLSRRRDEKILLKVPGIDEDIEVTIVQVDKNRVRLGFTAPENVTILRNELKNKQLKSF